jgi:Ca2+-binding EF-hand superfamily protein
MVEPIFPPEQRQNFKNAFDAFDENRDGLCSVEVLGKLLRAVGFNPKPTEVEDMVDDIGAPVFDFNAFLYIAARHGRAADPEGELIAAFRVFDKTGSGKLKVAIVKQILKNLKEPFTDTEIGELLGQAEIDARTDTVKYEEFARLMLEF